MAQDAHEPKLRSPPPGATTAPPDHVQKSQVYETFHSPKPTDSQDQPKPQLQPDSGETSPGEAGPRKPHARPTFTEGIQSIKSDDFLAVHKMPCAREGFLTGIGAGAVIGAGRFVLGAGIPKAANWAFGSFLLGSIIQWEYCQAQRMKERAAMARVVEVIDRKQAEKKAKMAEALRIKEEEEEKARQANKRWYKFWS
ncbi:hypothetical protein F5X96DRAFT_582211 [Biscogniauxia mediterranea]|nr:hypothetical protein F5X96DRAFT_582211 [Biscogniauxia mediterranea]